MRPALLGLSVQWDYQVLLVLKGQKVTLALPAPREQRVRPALLGLLARKGQQATPVPWAPQAQAVPQGQPDQQDQQGRRVPQDLQARVLMAGWNSRPPALSPSSYRLGPASSLWNSMAQAEAELWSTAMVAAAVVAGPTQARSWRSKKAKP